MLLDIPHVKLKRTVVLKLHMMPLDLLDVIVSGALLSLDDSSVPMFLGLGVFIHLLTELETFRSSIIKTWLRHG
jgi:hypothetical protein